MSELVIRSCPVPQKSTNQAAMVSGILLVAAVSIFYFISGAAADAPDVIRIPHLRKSSLRYRADEMPAREVAGRLDPRDVYGITERLN
jgi:hypothetical protein